MEGAVLSGLCSGSPPLRSPCSGGPCSGGHARGAVLTGAVLSGPCSGGALLRDMLCCCHLETVSNVWTRTLRFHFLWKPDWSFHTHRSMWATELL